MNIRNQIAQLQQRACHSQFSNDVRDISNLMDELGAAAVGGGCTRGEVSLLEILSEAPAHHRPNPSLHNQKETQ